MRVGLTWYNLCRKQVKDNFAFACLEFFAKEIDEGYISHVNKNSERQAFAQNQENQTQVDDYID